MDIVIDFYGEIFVRCLKFVLVIKLVISYLNIIYNDIWMDFFVFLVCNVYFI